MTNVTIMLFTTYPLAVTTVLAMGLCMVAIIAQKAAVRFAFHTNVATAPHKCNTQGITIASALVPLPDAQHGRLMQRVYSLSTVARDFVRVLGETNRVKYPGALHESPATLRCSVTETGSIPRF